MVDYLYTGQYEVPRPDSDEQCDTVLPLVFHAKMLDLADKYLIAGLQSISVAQFKQAVRGERDTCSFLRCISQIYSLQCESSKTLRDTVIDSVRERISQPLGSDVKEALDIVTDQVPSFTQDLLHSFLEMPILGYCSHCGPGKLVPVISLQCWCKICGKSGASIL